MSKDGIKIYKSSNSIKSFRKNLSSQNFSNQLINFSNKCPSSSSNNIAETIGDLSKCITNTSNFKITKKAKKFVHNKKKRKSKDISKLLKNKEKIKIPIGKRMSNVNNSSKLNLNNINTILDSHKPQETQEKEIKIRKDKNGIEINKNNKKKVHITFLDKISPNNRISEIIVIQSYKKYNNLSDDNLKDTDKNNCGVCCSIF